MDKPNDMWLQIFARYVLHGVKFRNMLKIFIISLFACLSFFNLFAEEKNENEDIYLNKMLSVVKESKKLTLLSIYPYQEKGGDFDSYIGEFGVIDSVTIDSSNSIDKFKTNFLKYLNLGSYRHYLCFIPRHAVKIEVNNNIHEILICLECERTKYFLNGKEKATMNLSSKNTSFFNQTLEKLGVKLKK